MATYLYRLAKFSFRQRRLMLGLWILILVGLGGAAAALKGPTSDSFTIPGIESQQAIDLLAQKFPAASADGGTARVVFVAPDGSRIDSGAPQQAVEQFIATAGKGPHVSSVSDPFTNKIVSEDGSTTYVTVTFDEQSSLLTVADQNAIIDAADTARASGLEVAAGGDALQAQSNSGATEIIGVLVGAVVLAITFGSFVAAGLPLLTAVIGVGVGLAGLFTISHWVELSSTAPILALMLGLAVGIDYALFIVSRYRSELMRGREPEEAIGIAAGTAGSAVVFAGLTVLIALSGLSIVGIPFLTIMGLAAAGTVAVAVLIALTLLPALLGFSGRKVIAARVPFVRRPDFDQEAADAPTNFGSRWAEFVTRHKIPVLIAGVGTLCIIAIPFFSMNTSLPDDSTAAKGTTQRQAYDLLADAFGPGFNGPLLIALTDEGSTDMTASAAAVEAQLKAMPGVASVSPPQLNQAGDTALLQVVPTTAPTSPATEDLVRSIRTLESSDLTEQGVRLYVTGATAVTIDVTDKLNSALPKYLVVVVGLALLLLALVFRSVIVPIKATVGFLLTIGATFGALVAIFQWGWPIGSILGVSQGAPIVSFLPIIIIAIVFGLAMDYEVFLVSRMREDFVHGAEPTEAVVGGFKHSARVVTAAAIIMISVFSGFMLGDDQIIKSVGFALAFGVLVDAFVVRMTIVPAVMALVGKSAWWLPRWLDKILPNVDVEGEKLLRELPASEEDKALVTTG